MSDKSDKLNQTQIMGVTACVLWGGMSLFITVGNSLGHNIWLSTLLAAAVAVLLAFPAGRWLQAASVRLNSKGCNTFFAVLGLVYALLFAAASAVAITELWRAWSMPRMPVLAYVPLLIAVMLYGGLRRGYAACARLAVISAVMLIFVEITDTLLLLPAMRLERLLPLADAAAADTMQAGAWQLLILFAGLPLLPFLLSQASEPATAKKGTRRGIIIAVCYTLLLETRNVLLLGDLITLERYPFLRSLKMVTVDIGVNRMEYVGIMALMAIAVNAGMLAFSVVEICGKYLVKKTEKV